MNGAFKLIMLSLPYVRYVMQWIGYITICMKYIQGCCAQNKTCISKMQSIGISNEITIKNIARKKTVKQWNTIEGKDFWD